MTGAAETKDNQPRTVLELRSVHKRFPGPKRDGLFAGRREVHALDDVSLDLRQGEVLGIVGESGCGKSTVARLLTFLQEPSSGEVLMNGTSLTGLSPAKRRELRKDIQIVFQDPYAALNPRFNVFNLISEAWRIFPDICPRRNWRRRAAELLEQVGLRKSDLGKYPSEFSGGQRQRICIARALSMEPKVLICDESVSALDVSVQAQILNLLQDLKTNNGLSIVFISHDLSVVWHMSDRIAVMYLGQVVEIGAADAVFRSPRHPYTQALLSAAPEQAEDTAGSKTRIILKGEVPSPLNPPTGCKFNTRCWKVAPVCRKTCPRLDASAGHTHQAACHFQDDPAP